MKKTIFIVLFALAATDAPAQITKERDLKVVQNFIQTVKSGDRQAISEIVNYNFPLRRGSSRPPIGSRSEFLALFDELFDENILNIIAGSDPQADWTERGWRGIVLLRGEIWLDHDGKLIAVNYKTKQSIKDYEFGEGWLLQQIYLDKDSLHILTDRDSVYTSNIRPGEELSIGAIHTDRFEFLGYSDQGDDLWIEALKDGKIYNFVANGLLDVIAREKQFQTGDPLTIDWKIDFMFPVWADNMIFVVKFAEKITKRADTDSIAIDRPYLERRDSANFVRHVAAEYEKYGLTKLSTLRMIYEEPFRYDDTNVSSL